jgi:hypothetical protein
MGLGATACAGGSAKVDTASRDSSAVSGPPAVPSAQPAPESARNTPATTPPPTPSPPTKAGSPSTKTPATASNEARADSVRGIVSVVGTSFDKHVMIAERGTSRRVEIVGTLSSLIGHVSGAEVSAKGARAGTQLNASQFIVRSVNGEPAIDGTLKTEGGSLFIVTAEGTRTRIVAPPPPLVGQDGARVWITGDPAKAVSSFGFIDPPR